ncbi:MAG: CinA family nicotinamide mononucleotide deamidase-related protein [candidate division WOR-3 bacterium]
MIKAGIVVTGEEVLRGDAYPTNSLYIARRLSEIGIATSRIVVVTNQKEILEEEIRRQLSSHQILFTCGGLGATPDDLIREVLSRIFRKPLLLDDATLKKIERFYGEKNIPVPEEATKQALYLQSSLLLENSVGISPGMIIQEGEKILIALPGPMEEMKKIFETGVLPFLETTFPLNPFPSVLIRTTGISEAEIMERLAHPKKKFKNCLIRYFPSPLGVDIKITTEKDKDLLAEWQKEVINRLLPYVYGVGKITLEERVGKLLRQRGLTLAVAESCTGGLLGDRITNAIGSSDYFLGGVVAYHNEIKRRVLGVKEVTLKRYGAVSREVALEMARGVQEYFGAHIGLSTTGIAGPTGGSAKKPVGLVYIGLVTGNKALVRECHFPGDRRMVKEQAAQVGLDILRRYLEGYD